MRKNILFLVFIFVLFHYSINNLYAQKTTLDSLHVELQNAKIDSLKVNILNELTLFLRRSYPDSALSFAEQARSLALQINYRNGLAESYKNIGNIYNSKDNFREANNYYQESLKEYQKLGNTLGIAKIYNNLGVLNRNQGNFIHALEYYQKSLELRKQIGDKSGMGKTYNNIGNLHRSQGNLNLALEYYIKSLEIRTEFNDKLGMSGCYNSIGITYIDKKYYNLAIEYFQKAITIYYEFEDKFGIGHCYESIGTAYFGLGNYTIALEYFRKSLKIYEELGDRIEMSFLFTGIAKVHNEMKNYKLAKNYAERSLQIANIVGAINEEKDAYIQLSIAYEGLADYEKSLKYHKLFLMTKDSIFSVEKMRELESIESKYQLENKQLQIENLVNENKLKSVMLEKMQIRQMLSYVLIFVFVFIIISLIIIRSKLKKKNATIFEQNEEILSQKDELETHRNHLEKLVDERTQDLKIAKEKAEESDRLKSAFLANMSHEIRTPLNVIVGFSSLITNSDISAKQKDEISYQVSHNSNMLLHLIDDIIDLSKIESNQLKIDIRECNINKIFNLLFEIFDEKRKNLSKNKIEIKINNKLKKEDFKINTDPIRLQQILSNLLDNAFKFTEKGFIEYGCFSSNDKENTFYVKDTGIGMSPEQQSRIFTRFSKIEDDKKRLYRGAGLGLAISKNLIELLGGKIWVESEKDVGSIFYFTIPFSILAKNE